MIVSRTCTELPPGEQDRHQPGEKQSRPLEEFRETPAYVLLGDPGAGKTTAFESERDALGEEKACKIPARNFLAFDPKNHPEWRGKVLFIDGLDEVRAGSADIRTPLRPGSREARRTREGRRSGCRAGRRTGWGRMTGSTWNPCRRIPR